MRGGEMITFAPGVLGEEPARLPLIAKTPEFFAIAKPAGVAVAADALWPDAPCLLEAIAAGLRVGRPQFASLGLGDVRRLHGLDPEATGAVVFAAGEAAAGRLRNAAGSGQWEFVFDLVAERAGDAAPMVCDLPLARDEASARVFVSHRHGKKSRTAFAPVRELGRYVLWEARTADNRAHQIRLHATESRLRIPGEVRYGRVRPVYLSALKRGYRGDREDERPLHGGLCLHLREVHLAGTVVTAPRPRSFEAMLRRLEEAGGARGVQPD